MRTRRTILTLCTSVALGAALLVTTACSGSDVSQGDLDKVQQQLKDQQNQNQQLQQQLANAPKTAASTTPAASPSASTNAVTVLIGAVKKAAAPTATPLPAGAVAPTAAPRETPPPSTYTKAGEFYVYAETLATTTTSKYEVASSIACTPSGAFARGQRIVFRYDIVDLSTGIRLNDKDGSVVKVVLPNGDESTGRFGQRGGGQVPGAPFMFSSNWDIPLDFPLGSVDYKIVITAKDGRTMTWKPPALVSEPLKEDTRPKVVQ
ncbi:MAG: hypothetical protein ABI782_11505 [Anaerolineaceae bacterium]